MPTVLGTRIDRLVRMRAKRMKKQRELEALKKAETEFSIEIQEFMIKQKMTKVSGVTGTFSVKQIVIPTVENWPLFWKFLRQSDRLDVLQKRVGVEAYREIVEDGTIPPGTKPEKIWKSTLSAKR